jgi:hypothetical protein
LKEENKMKIIRYKLIILFFSVFMIQYSILNSQDTWLHTYNPFSEAIFSVEDVLIFSDGGYAVNGTCIDLETLIGWGFVLKTDSEGNMQWARKDTVSFQSENESWAIIDTDDGGVISASWLFLGGSAMIKRDSDGNREWVNLLEDFYIHSMARTNDGNIITAGSNYINYEEWPTLTKIDQNTNIIWNETYSFENYEWGTIKSVTQSTDEGYLLTGYVKDNETEDAILVIKTDANGDSLWTRVLDETSLDDRGYTIVESEEGNIFVGGYLEGISGFVWKLDSEGNTNWLETGTINCGYGFTSFAKSSDGLIVSIFEDLVFDNSLRKFDSDYNIEWTNDLPYYSGSGDKALGITSSEHIVVALYNPPYIALTKLNSDGTDIDENVISASTKVFNAYPNPFNPTTIIGYSIPQETDVVLKIYNIKGQLLKVLVNDFKNAGEHSIIWNGRDSNGNRVSSGIYFYKLKAGDFQKVSKMILLK